MITICGIKNCDTMKRARSWLESNKVAHHFHDYKAAGIDTAAKEPLGHNPSPISALTSCGS
jgi:arsenate reductase